MKLQWSWAMKWPMRCVSIRVNNWRKIRLPVSVYLWGLSYWDLVISVMPRTSALGNWKLKMLLAIIGPNSSIVAMV